MELIPVDQFTLGFLIYITFCLLTFEAYSRRDQITPYLLLAFFYLYYTLLAIYVINLFDDSMLTTFIQGGFYAIPGAIVCYFYYLLKIKPKEKPYYKN